MKNYEVITPLRGVVKGEDIAPGEVVSLDPKHVASLVRCGALRETSKSATVAGTEKPLAKMNRAELDAIVAAEGVEVPTDAKTNADVVKAIEALRAAKGPL